MTTQVVVFSVMLFGASGLVLDFGRVYSEHTLMQSFTDQAALAAAAELDFEPDSIDRAVAAVFGADSVAPLSKGANWSQGEGNKFNIEYLIFLNELAPDAGLQTAMGNLSSASSIYVHFADGSSTQDKASAAVNAKYVIAVAEERSVRNSLLMLVNSAPDTGVKDSNVVKTIAAAKRKVLNCGTRTNLVMCNPFEGSETGLKSFIADGSGNVGVQFHMIADGTLSTTQKLGMMLAPNSQPAVSSYCDDINTLPGYDPSMSDAEAYRTRMICHLAAAQPAQSCMQEKVEIVPARAEVIQTALGTAFDLWDEPISEVLNGSVPPATKAMFQPDIDIAKGRVQESASVIAANIASGIPPSSRRNYTDTATDFDGGLSACFRQANNSLCQPGVPHVSLPYSYGEMLSYYTDYWRDHFLFVAGGAIPGFEVSTMYRVYGLERTEWPYSPFKDFEPPFGEPESLAQIILDSDGVAKREDASLLDNTGAPMFARHQENFANYSNPGVPFNTQERRRFGVTFVNCGSASTTVNSAIGETVSSADVVGFADVYLVQPPRPVCPDGSENCANDDLAFSRLFLEFVEQSETTENTYSVLVR